MDDIVERKNPNGTIFKVRYGDIFIIARIHLGLTPFDKSFISYNIYFLFVFKTYIYL